MSEKTEEAVNLDAILIEVGQFGRFQLINYAYIVIPIIFSAIYNSNYIFNAAATDYRCLVPECDSIQPVYQEAWWSIALPAESEARCNRYTPSNSTAPSCVPSNFLQETIACDRWVYRSSDSIVAEFDLACEEWKRTLVGTIHSLGLFAALPITGYVSDRFGRRIALCLTAVSGGLLGLVRSFTTTYEGYITLEFLESTFGSGVYSTGFILALELVGPDRRVVGGNIISAFYAFGQVIIALVAWWLPYWRTLTRVVYTPSLLFFLYYFLVVESVRWLLSKGRKQEAVEIIKQVAIKNKKTLSKTALASLEIKETVETNGDTGTKHTKSQSLPMQVLKSPRILMRLCICSFWWVTVTFVYYGLSINSVSLAGNSYVNYIMTSLIEIPGYVLSVLTLDRFGRKRSIMTSFFICGVSLVSLPFIPDTLSWLVTSLSMVGKLCISMTFSSIYIYTSELFPTNSRHSLLGFCSMIGRIGSIVAPQTPLLASYMASLPYLLFGAFAVIAGLLMTLTPETLRAQLPDTIQQAENVANLKMRTSD